MRKTALLRAFGLFVSAAFLLQFGKAQFQQVNLVSDSDEYPAAHIDPNLVNPWGIAFSPSGPFWIADNGTGVSTVYDGQGNPFPPANPLVVSMVPKGTAPTGIVFNHG